MPEMEPIPDIKDIIAPPEVIDPNINFFLIIGIIIGSIILLAYRRLPLTFRDVFQLRYDISP